MSNKHRQKVSDDEDSEYMVKSKQGSYKKWTPEENAIYAKFLKTCILEG